MLNIFFWMITLTFILITIISKWQKDDEVAELIYEKKEDIIVNSRLSSLNINKDYSYRVKSINKKNKIVFYEIEEDERESSRFTSLTEGSYPKLMLYPIANTSDRYILDCYHYHPSENKLQLNNNVA